MTSKMLHVALAAGLVVPVLPLPALAADSCLVVAENKAQRAQIQYGSERLDVPPSRPVPDCSSIFVFGAPVILIFEPPINGQRTKTCDPGRCGAPGGVKSPSLASILEGVPQRRAAGKRYDEDARRLEGVPSGKIHSLERAGAFDFRALGAGAWGLVVTKEPGRTMIFQRSGSDPVIQLPQGLFQRGGKYGWVLTSGGKRFTGGFDVLAPGPAAEVERDLREAGVTPGSRTRRQQIEELMVLFDHDLDHEVRLLYRELGL